MRKQKYTLVEILAVVAIIAILCGIIFGASGAIRSRNAEVKTRAMLKQIEIAFEECKNKFGYYPVQASFGDLEKSLFIDDNDDPPGNDVKKKYSIAFKKACNFSSFEIDDGKICDAWGEPLQYKSDGKSFTLFSMGQDADSKLDGGEIDEDAEENEDNIYLD